VRSALGPDVELRLDANGAWSAEQAIERISALDEFDLGLVEQPVAAADLDGLVRVRRAVHPPITADESITSLADAKHVIDMDAAQVLVVKPMVVGGLRVAKEIIDLAQNSGVQVIITTTIDAGVGTAAALHLAATLPEGSPACGLATGSLLADDIVTKPPFVREGQMTLPSRPGLGIEIDEAKLAQYSGTERTLP
jgi:L-alanine-DL-glutamate epimerase-like enolase superfamily enzyme